jgi:hypothetical protein
VCDHAERGAIDRSLAANESNRAVSLRFGLSVAALQRHRANHLPKVLARAQRRAEQRREAAHADAVGVVAQQRDEQEQARAFDIVRELRAINGASLQILNEARQAGNGELVLKAVDRVQRQIELQAKLLGDLSDQPQINILTCPEWIMLRGTLIEVLSDYPEAQDAVLARLHSLEDGTTGRQAS